MRSTSSSDPPCIEVRSLLGTVRTFTVETYEAALKRARHFSSPRGLSFRELMWTVEAPPVEGLTLDVQMRRVPNQRLGRLRRADGPADRPDRLMGGRRVIPPSYEWLAQHYRVIAKLVARQGRLVLSQNQPAINLDRPA